MAKRAQIGYKKWMPKNIETLKKKCRHYLDTEKKPELIRMLTELAERLVAYIDDDARIPESTGNLRDATGVGVYVDGVLLSYVPTKRATQNQKSGFHYTNEYGIDGSEYLSQAISDAAGSFSKGIWIVLFSAVPYAYFLNKPELVGNLKDKVEGNFFGEIADRLVQEIYLGMLALKPNNFPKITRYEDL